MVDYNNTVVVFNVLRAECIAPSLTIKNLISFESFNFAPFNHRCEYMLKTFYKSFSLIPFKYSNFFNTFHTFLQYTSWYEIENIFYAYILSTFEFDTNYEKPLKCPNCNYTYKTEIKISDFIDMQEFKIWDKNKPYFEYIFNYINNNFNVEINFYIPNIATFLSRLTGYSNNVIENNLNNFNDYFSPIELLTLHTYQIKVKDIIITVPKDIYQFYTELPSELYKDISKFYQENIAIYRAKYQLKQICPNCKTKFILSIYPITEFMNISNQLNKNNLVEKYIDMFRTLYIITDNKYTNLNDFFNLPYPLFVKLSEKLFEDYKRKIKQYEKINKQMNNEFNTIRGKLK